MSPKDDAVDGDGDRYEAGEPTRCHEVRRSAPDIDGNNPVIRFSAGQFVFRQGGAGEHAAAEPGTRRYASGFECGCLLLRPSAVTPIRSQGTDVSPSGTGHSGKGSVIVFEEFDPCAYLWGI